MSYQSEISLWSACHLSDIIGHGSVYTLPVVLSERATSSEPVEVALNIT